MRRLQVVRAGPSTTVQDLGRPGWAHLGVPRSGALDPVALRWANRLVGNPEGAAALETTLGGCAVRPDRAAVVAVTGALAEVTVDGRAADWGLAVHVPAGATVAVGPARTGVRSYLAVGGGVAVDAVLGSRSTDTLSGLGPARLRDGDVLPLGAPSGRPAPVDVAPYSPAPHPVRVRVRLGPRADWLTEESLGVLLSGDYVVSSASDRIGARLDGPALQRAVCRELPSEGVVLGSVQVPPDGRPVLFLNDHPTTGGYPVVAVVDESDLPLVAQAPPGAHVRLVER